MTRYLRTTSPEFLDVKETAAYLRVCAKTVYRLIKAKELCAHQVGKQRRIAPADLRSYLATTRS